MDKKYYDIIVSLIKEHKKFIGCESILDDIAEDVYSHSKVVIDSITNEDVLISYFKKVVSTSIVTVPKKFNIKTRQSSPIVLPSFNAETQNTNYNIKNESEIEVATDDSSSKESAIFVSNEVPIPEQDDSLEDIVQEEENELDSVELNDNSEDDILQNLSEQADNENYVLEITENNTVTVEEITATEEEATTEEDINRTSANDHFVDKTLVDKMINGITEGYTDQENNIEELSVENEVFESLVIEEAQILAEEETEEDSSVLDITEDINNTSDNEALISESEEELVIEATDIESLIEGTEILTSEIVDPNGIKEEEEEEEEEVLTDRNVSFMPPSFKCFNYTPEFPDYEIGEIFAELESIDERHPEKQILKICDLKYNKKLSVKEISDTLEMNTEDVIYVLGEIIETVKD